MGASLNRILDLRWPLIQAPMAGVSTPALAAAVSNAGALGSLALGALDATGAERALAETREMTSRPFAANVFVHPAPQRDPLTEQAWLDRLTPLFDSLGGAAPEALAEIYRSFNDDDDMLEVLRAAPPAAVSFHFGVPAADRVDALKAAGCLLIATATSAPEARALVDAGIDVLIAQGVEAGGHFGAFSPGTAGQPLDVLMAELLDAVDVPVVAAGGLVRGADVRRALDAGAAGVQLGTAFISCPETIASPAYVAALQEATPTRVSHRLSGRPARGLDNALLRALEALPGPVPEYPLPYDATKQLVALAGDPAFAVMWSGTSKPETVGVPAGELVARLMRDATGLASGVATS